MYHTYNEAMILFGRANCVDRQHAVRCVLCAQWVANNKADRAIHASEHKTALANVVFRGK